MNEPNLLKQAREGDPAAVAALMNQSLNPKGIHAKAAARGDRLLIRLESQTPPDQTLLTKFVQSGIQNLNPAPYKAVEVSGKGQSGDRPVWTSVIDLGQQSMTSKSPQSTSSASVPPVAPPPPPAPPTFGSAPSSTPSPAPIESQALDAGSENALFGAPEEQSAVAPTRLQRDTLIPKERQGTSERPQEYSSQMNDPATEATDDMDYRSQDDTDFYGASSDEEDQDESFEPTRRSRSLVPADLPGPIDFSAPSSSKSSALSGILFIAVLLVLLGATGGLIGYALWSYFDGGGSITDPALAPPPPIENGETGEGTATSEAEPAEAEPQSTPAELLQEAIEKADSAVTLAQTAQSGDDWNLVASQWQRAVTLLESVPEGSPEYSDAQNRLANYRSQLANAQQQSSQLSNAASAPLPSTVVATNREPECEAIASGNNAQPIQLSSVRFSGNGSNGAQPVTGCITNNSEQAIASATIEYTTPAAAPAEPPPEGETPAPTTTRTEIQFSSLEPGATVPFTASLQVPADQSEVQITSVSWTPAGASEAQTVNVAVPLAAPEN